MTIMLYFTFKHFEDINYRVIWKKKNQKSHRKHDKSSLQHTPEKYSLQELHSSKNISWCLYLQGKEKDEVQNNKFGSQH